MRLACAVDDDAPRTSGRENGENGKDASARVTSAAPSLAVTESDFGAPRSNVSTRSNFVSVINGKLCFRRRINLFNWCCLLIHIFHLIQTTIPIHYISLYLYISLPIPLRESRKFYSFILLTSNQFHIRAKFSKLVNNFSLLLVNTILV